ncbi:lysoplasmalogenase [Janibacter cremeus]|uniref:Putative membrane protein YhhN n=1 Tax=Janibacter cremeus TaxID=1285192 RepID=A0A852VVI8_9MICO|nr:lysoplasmalogenase [Janibacter cremeus]NYF98304.1 putative membrane protein YhhN [Janibacter cremeus]
MPIALLALVVVSLVHLGAQVAAPDGVVADLTQILLMPALLWVLLTSTPNPKSLLVRLVALALGLSWLGDTLPRFIGDGSDLGFGLMLGAFFLAQLAYVAAFLPFASRSIIRRRPALLAPYVILLAVIIAVTANGAGALFPVVLLYGLVIVGMAVLATGIDAVATTGAVLFLVSDGLIAISAFATLQLPLHGFWVMLTYVLGQTLITLAVCHQDRALAAQQV